MKTCNRPDARISAKPRARCHEGVALVLCVSLAVPAAAVRDVAARAHGASINGQTGRTDTLPQQKAAAEISRQIHTAADSLTRQLQGAGLGRESLADRIELTLDELRRHADRVPRDTFDAAAIIRLIGTNPGSLLAWVRDQTALVAYRGVLRGAEGVLMDRVGNSLDRSLLLAELITRAGGNARLAHTSLSPGRVKALAQDLPPRGALTEERARPANADPATFATSYAARFGGDPVRHDAQLAALRAATEAAGRDITQRSEAQSALLLRLAGDALSPAGEGIEDVYAALADHWWVQLHSPEGWTNLDPAGVVPLIDDGSVQADRTASPAAIESNLRHQVTIRFLITCLTSNRLEERLVLEHTAAVASLAGVPVRISNLPVGGPNPDPALVAAVDPGPGFAKWLEAQTSWLPVLAVGTQLLTSKKFTRSGEVLSDAPASAAAGLLGALGGDEEPAGGGPGMLAGGVLEFEVYSPGAPTRIERRVLFDWTGPPTGTSTVPSVTRDWADGALDVMTETEVLVLGAQPSSDYVALQSAGAAIRHGSALLRVLRPPARAGTGPAPQADPPAAPLLDLYNFALARHSWSPAKHRIVLIEPNVLTRHVGLARGADGSPRQWAALDVVANRVGVAPLGATDGAVVRLRQGVFDTNLEVLFDRSDSNGASTVAANVSEAMAGGAQIVPVTAADDSHNRFLRDALGRGHRIFMVGAERQSASWWQIDLRTGSTLGYTPRGWGGTSGPETAKTTVITATNSMRITARYFLTLLCVSQVATKHVAQLVRAKQSARAAARQGVPDASGDLAPGGGGAAVGVALCVVGHGLSGVGTYLGGARGAPWSLAGDIVSVVMSMWSVAATYDALASMLEE
jgi:hypothetical protein